MKKKHFIYSYNTLQYYFNLIVFHTAVVTIVLGILLKCDILEFLIRHTRDHSCAAGLTKTPVYQKY